MLVVRFPLRAFGGATADHNEAEAEAAENQRIGRRLGDGGLFTVEDESVEQNLVEVRAALGSRQNA